MNQTFNFKRFGTYFRYDLTQMWRNHSRAAILIGGASAIFYILWVLFSLVFTREWHAPMIEARVIMFIVAFAALELYQVKTYGYITEKKAGSSWLMIPASRAEKFVSMLLVSLIVVPLMFIAVYAAIDGFLSLVDPTYGEALAGCFFANFHDILEALSELNMETAVSVNLSMTSLIITSIAGFFCNFLYFLLCGVCFKRNKLVGAFAILFAFSVVLSIIMGFVTPMLFESWPGDDITEEMVLGWTNGIVTGSVIVACLMAVGFAWGIWYRIKTIQH